MDLDRQRKDEKKEVEKRKRKEEEEKEEGERKCEIRAEKKNRKENVREKVCSLQQSRKTDTLPLPFSELPLSPSQNFLSSLLLRTFSLSSEMLKAAI